MIRSIAILGSTGSIGTQALEVLRELRKQNIMVEVIALAAGRNISLLEQQIQEFQVKLASVERASDIPVLRSLDVYKRQSWDLPALNSAKWALNSQTAFMWFST